MNDLQAKSTNSLALCPFCKSEAVLDKVDEGADYRPWFWYTVHCSNRDCVCADLCHEYETEVEAIAEWNTRASDRHAYEQRITGDGSDWGEIMRDAYDDLMASACESCTPEQMGQLVDYIRAELGSGTCEFVVKDNMNESEGMGDVWIECSACHCQFDYYADDWLMKMSYCPNCSARNRKAVKR